MLFFYHCIILLYKKQAAKYRQFLYIKLFPYTKVHKSSLLAPRRIGNSSISSYSPISGFPRSKCGYRRKGHFLRFSPNLPRNTDISAPNCLLQCLKSVFNFLLHQKHRLPLILQTTTRCILCVFLHSSSKTQNSIDYSVSYKLKTLCFKQYLA